MQHKKAILISFLLLQFAVTAIKAQNIYFKFSNSTYAQYALSNIRNITFSANHMNLNMISGSAVSLPVSTISGFNYSGYNGSTDIVTISEGKEISIYPNPSNGTLTFNYTNTLSDIVTIEFMTITGDLLNTFTQATTVGNNNVTLSVTDTQGRDLPVGTYLCRIKTAQEAIIKKIIVSK